MDSSAADQSLRAPLDRGAVIGRYTILARVGGGGRADVYAAYDPELNRKVALKLLRGGGADPARAQARLLSEAQAMARLSHPNVVAVHDVGAHREGVFVAMEFVDGLTVEDWLAACPRARPEIVDVFVSVARGLAAAHDAGLVHGAFTAANVMIAKTGAVRLLSFSRARHEGEATGSGADGDQLAFCAALQRALYGTEPAAREPPKSGVPARLRRILLRGLAPTPDARWPSMHALAAALAHDPARARRQWIAGLTALVLVALSVVTFARNVREVAPSCLGGPSRLTEVWAPSRRDAVERAFLASGAPAATEVWGLVAPRLDGYVAGWLAMYREACEATNVRRQQSAAILDLRMTCLDERRTALAALTDVLVRADRDVVSNAVGAVNALPALARCADLTQLQLSIEPPPDEATRRRVDDIHGRLAVTKALNDTGKHAEALSRARALLAEARGVGYRPLLAEALTLLQNALVGGREADLDVDCLNEALWTSVASGRDDLAAEMAIMMVYRVGVVNDRPAADVIWTKLAQALIERAGPGHEILSAWLLQNQGVAEIPHDPEAALRSLRGALLIKERVLPADHPDVARTLMSLADGLHHLGRNAEAVQLAEKAHASFARTFGPASLEAAISLSNEGEDLIDVGRSAEAVGVLRTALAHWQAQVGPSNPKLAYPLTGLGRALVLTARPRDASLILTRALDLREHSEPSGSLVAETRFALAQALWDAGNDRARARREAEVAGRTFAESDPNHAAVVDAWLATHRGR